MNKKSDHIDEEDPLDREFDISNARRNPYAPGYPCNRNLRILAPDLLAVFPDSESVNEALHTLVRVAASVAAPLKRSAKTVAAPKSKKARA